LRRLAELQLGQADRFLRQAQLAALAQQEAAAGATFGPSPSGTFGRALGEDPIAAAVTTKFSGQLQQASTKYESAATGALATFQQIVELRPEDQQSLFSLAQAADTLRQTDVAIQAYTRLLALDLDPATKAQIRERIRTLRQSGPP
jgi:hypothetical protein